MKKGGKKLWKKSRFDPGQILTVTGIPGPGLFWPGPGSSRVPGRALHTSMGILDEKSLKFCFRNLERDKKRAYYYRVIQIDGGTFDPRVFTAIGTANRGFYKWS